MSQRLGHLRSARGLQSDFDDCAFDGSFPVEGELCFLYLYDLPTSSPDFLAGTTNYEYWKDCLRLEEEEA